MFSDKADETITHDPVDRLAEKGISEQRPDRVFGLEVTKSFTRYISDAPLSIRHSPFADGNVLYPFLIIEAKTEKGGSGFASIETQTAFPMRTCLKLQQELCRASGVKLDPLVWCLACQGDEWRVSVAVIEQDKFVSPTPRPR